jgi:hypothetical protein
MRESAGGRTRVSNLSSERVDGFFAIVDHAVIGREAAPMRVVAAIRDLRDCRG